MLWSELGQVTHLDENERITSCYQQKGVEYSNFNILVVTDLGKNNRM